MTELIAFTLGGALAAYLLLGTVFAIRAGEAKISYILFWWWIEIMANAIANIFHKGRRKKK
jgi:hypothetical protein